MARNEWWQWDDDLINFYPLAELIRCAETAGQTARFVFAAHCISAHEYAVGLTSAPPLSGSVYAIGSGPVLIARTFPSSWPATSIETTACSSAGSATSCDAA